MTVSVYSSAVLGIDATTITVETLVGTGLGYTIVGLPDDAVKESLYRVESAITSCGCQMPRQKILVSMAPAALRKQGAVYDLPIALTILAASGQVPADKIKNWLFTGELSLQGRLRPVNGVLSMSVQARKEGIKCLIAPLENAEEAAIVSGLEVYGFSKIKELVLFLKGKLQAKPVVVKTRELFAVRQNLFSTDFSDVRGQKEMKRAMEIVAAGGHNALLIGPPGSGKTMLAKRLQTILPPLDLREALETTRIHSVSGLLDGVGLLTERPFRSPHHTASDIALVGGGSVPQPGEISLAHNGVLFLDELPEFKRRVLEVLRQPLEERQIAISRANFSANFPANFILLAAMNPCPCGYFKHTDRKCTCTPQAIRQYIGRISGPLLDRIDLHIQVAPVDFRELKNDLLEEKSETIRGRVIDAREIQNRRFAGLIGSNAQMSTQTVSNHCRLDKMEQKILFEAMEKYKLSARSYERILKVARTIADLANSEKIRLSHLSEAIGFRCLDKDYLKT
jgi:magnesium chelatase family protein